MRKKRRIRGDFDITSTVIPKKHAREFIAEMLETNPAHAQTPSLPGEKAKHRKLSLTATGRWHHSIFRPFPRSWEEISKNERDRLYHYFTHAAKAHAAEIEETGYRRAWKALLASQRVLINNRIHDIDSNLRSYERNHGNPGETILREAEKYKEGWKNLRSILTAIIARADKEE
jgi:hypothetical protein